MPVLFPNVYNHRKVGESSAKSCDTCYRMTTSVLITPDQKDFFYICPAHLRDRNFCTPKIDEDGAKAQRDKELAEETERVKKEYEEKLKRKKEKEDKEKEEKEKAEKEKSNMAVSGFKAVGSGLKWGAKMIWEGPAGEETQASEANPGAKPGQSGDSGTKPAEDGDLARVFELKNAFYAQRLQKKRQAEAAKRDKERVSQPGYFPSVPTHEPGK